LEFLGEDYEVAGAETDTESLPSVTVTLPSIKRHVSFSVYSQSKVLASHCQVGQALQTSASSSDGFLTITSFIVGILILLL